MIEAELTLGVLGLGAKEEGRAAKPEGCSGRPASRCAGCLSSSLHLRGGLQVGYPW